MFVIAGRRTELERALRGLLADFDRRVTEDLAGIRGVADLADKVRSLREELETLEIEKGRREEEISRKEREMEHKVGLERARQKQELEAGKREAALKVREENLDADRKRFEEQMAFHEKRFTEEVGYLKGLMEALMTRLPDVNATLELTPPRRRSSRG